tara:strand:- start:20908 stop:21411 length:504 start_codon:yes stop_codon:yes gene_type:complete
MTAFKAYACPAIVAAVVAVCVYCLSGADFPVWYRDNLRRDVFYAFIILSGLLFYVTTYIVVTMREEFSDPEYAHMVNGIRSDLGKSPETTSALLAPLKRLSRLLTTTVVVCLATALVNATLGFVPHPLSVAVCLGVAAGSVVFIVVAVVLSHANLCFHEPGLLHDHY